MSNLSNILTRFTDDLKTLKKAKEAKKEAKANYNNKARELGALTEDEIGEQSTAEAQKNISTLKALQNSYGIKSNEYANAVLKMQSDFEETYSTVLHSLIDTVYDARKMMHYLTTVRDHDDSDFIKDNENIRKYLERYNGVSKFDETSINMLIDEVKKLNKSWNSNERKKLMSAFSRHEKEDLQNLKTFVRKKKDLEKTLREVNLSESVETLPTTDEIITNYKRLIPKLWDKEGGEEMSMNDALNTAYAAFFPKHEAKKELEYKTDFKPTLIVPLYADPIIVVSFDFKLEFEFKANLTATASIQGPIRTASVEAKCSLSFGVSAALSLRIIQLIKASINAGIKFETSVGAKAEVKSQIAYLGGEIGIKAEAKLVAKAWISLGICGPVAAIIKAATDKDPELRWLLGELVLFKLEMDKKAELKLDPMGNEFKADANFRPFRDGFTIEFIGKEAIKRKLNEKYNNKLAVIKQQFLSGSEMAAAHDDKMALLQKFDVNLDAGGTGNNNFKTQVKNRTSFMMRYESYYNNFMGKLVESIDPNPKEFQKTSMFVNSYAMELKNHYHDKFILLNGHTAAVFDEKTFKDAQDDVWLDFTPDLRRVLAERETDLIAKLGSALAGVKDKQKYVSKLTALEIVNLEYISANLGKDYKGMSNLVEQAKKDAKEYVEEIVIGDIGSGPCIFGYSSIEIFPSKRKLKHEAIAELETSIDGFITEAKAIVLSKGDLLAELKRKLNARGRELKVEFDQRKIDAVDKAYHQHFIDKKYAEEVIGYFERIESQLDLSDLDPIKDGAKKLKEFHDKNVNYQDYLELFDKANVKAIYDGTKEFKHLVIAKIKDDFSAQMDILTTLNADVSDDNLYSWFKEDKNQQKLEERMDNVNTLNEFVEDHREIALEKKGVFSDTTYKDYIEKTPDKLEEKLKEVLDKYVRA